MKLSITHLRISVGKAGLLFALSLMGCMAGGKDEAAIPPQEYEGVGQHQTGGQSTGVTGEIKLKNPTGDPIVVEARYSVPCEYGHCPVIGNAPLAQTSLTGPGTYQLAFEDSAQDVMIIAVYQPQGKATRIAHRFLGSTEQSLTGIDLSLDKPYPPLR